MTGLTSLHQIGPKTEQALHQIGIATVSDLLHFYPFRYIDFSQVKAISDYELGIPTTFTGVVTVFQNIFTRSHKNIQKAVITDHSGKLELIWFNQPYLSKLISQGKSLSVAGSVMLYQGRPAIINPQIGHKTGRIIPVYHQSATLSSNQIEKIINLNLPTLLDKTVELLPQDIITKYQLTDIKLALRQIHQPTSQKLLEIALIRVRLIQSLSLMAASQLQKRQLSHQQVPYLLTKIPTTKFLPYTLSPSQKTAWNDVKNDLLSTTPTHRLLCGDVGSGKTIIALLAAHLAHANHQTTLLVVPTQILAQQHFDFFKKTLPNHPVILLTGNSQKIPRDAIIISTHTAFYKKTDFLKKIALLIIDEQHKFGVIQRNFLSKLTRPPHNLSLTATPIPRTLALSIYGHLQVSYIQHLPRWRPVKTFIVPTPKQEDCYHWLDKHLQTTQQQAFIVCPFIEDSDKKTEVVSATTEYDRLSKLFPHLKIALIHSQISIAKRQQVFDDFRDNKINILVTTPIIEVGIDYPNATVIIIQSADRFGLATLHQLRGRVGRGQESGFCYLFSTKSNLRLEYLTNHYEGQQLAEFDLSHRGPGQIFSTIQHGHFPLNPQSIALATKIITDLITKNYDLNLLINSNPNTSYSD